MVSFCVSGETHYPFSENGLKNSSIKTENML